MTEHRSIVCAALAAVVFAAPALAQPAAPPKAAAVRVTAPVNVDGVLDEPFWETIAPITEFVQREPQEGAPITERTEVRIAYNDRYLYFGFTLHDSNPGGIVKSVLQREGPSQNDDHIIIGLDTFYDRRNAYIFGLNPFGTQEDAIVTDEGQPDWNWEGVYASNARITDHGWTLEVGIPFSTIRLSDVPEPVMGVLLYRQIRRKNEEATWPAIGRNYRSGNWQVSQYARLEGLRDVNVGRNLQIKPYVFAGVRNPARNLSPETEWTRNVGVDVRYAVTTASTLDLTYNTDFAQAEADNAQLNLTRFSVFFPEKRDFFLERNGLFAFGSGQGGFRQSFEAATFFSRRIGLNQPILGGGRYAGRAGRVTMGYLDIQTRDDGDLQGENFAVARVKADISSRRTVGAIFTNVQGGDRTNRAAGADLAFRLFQSSTLTGWVSNVWDPRYQESTAAGNANLQLRNDKYSYTGDYLNVGRNFDPAIGYVRRADMVRYSSDVGFNPRPASGPIRQFRFNAGGQQIFGQDGVKQSTNAYVRGQLNFQSGDEVGFAVTNDSDRPEEAFEIAGAPLPAGRYSYTYAELSAESSEARRISQRIGWEHGGFYGGTKTSYEGRLGLKVRPQLQLSYNFQVDRLRLPVAGGDFTTQLHGVDLFVAANRNLYANSLFQYDNVSRRFQANIRVRWIHRPGSDLFLVYNTSHRFVNFPDVRTTSDDQKAGVVKLTYLIGL
jgi:hypothetical protein